MPSPLIQFRALPLLSQYLQARIAVSVGEKQEIAEKTLSDIARRDLDRYYTLLHRSLPTFSLGEAELLVDALNGVIHQPSSVSLLWAEIDDAVQEGFAEKHQVDGPALVARLRTLTPFECMAVVDAVERAWLSSTWQISDMRSRVLAVGLVRKEGE